jgi:hypothetical protein
MDEIKNSKLVSDQVRGEAARYTPERTCRKIGEHHELYICRWEAVQISPVHVRRQVLTRQPKAPEAFKCLVSVLVAKRSATF